VNSLPQHITLKLFSTGNFYIYTTPAET